MKAIGLFNEELTTIYRGGLKIYPSINLYIQKKIITGFICISLPEGRLLDKLNQDTGPESGEGFLEIYDVTVRSGNNEAERTPATYVNKAIIHLVSTMVSDSFGSLSTREGLKYYPYKEKSPIPIRLETTGYSVMGFMHMANCEKIMIKLAQKAPFLPLTDAEVCNLANNTRWKFPFVAVNLRQIILLHEMVSDRVTIGWHK